MKPRLRTAFGNDTSVGMVRTQQQDYFGSTKTSAGHQLFLVCDGMGGHRAGNKASVLAVTRITEYVGEAPAGENPETLLRNSFKAAGEAITQLSSSDESYKGMGTTCVALLVDTVERTAWVAHVGDSRTYLIRQGKIERLTTDHSRVQEMVARGLLTEEQAFTHPERNVITRAMGAGQPGEPDVRSLAIEESDRFVLCTDGVTGYFRDDEIRAVASSGEAQAAASDLIRESNRRGGEDNSTAVVVDILSSASAGGKGGGGASHGWGSRLWLLPVVLLACLVGALLGGFFKCGGETRQAVPSDSLASTGMIRLVPGVSAWLVPGDSVGMSSDSDPDQFIRFIFDPSLLAIEAGSEMIQPGEIVLAGDLFGREMTVRVDSDSALLEVRPAAIEEIIPGELVTAASDTIVYSFQVAGEGEQYQLWTDSLSVELLYPDHAIAPPWQVGEIRPLPSGTYSILCESLSDSICVCPVLEADAPASFPLRTAMVSLAGLDTEQQYVLSTDEVTEIDRIIALSTSGAAEIPADGASFQGTQERYVLIISTEDSDRVEITLVRYRAAEATVEIMPVLPESLPESRPDSASSIESRPSPPEANRE
jgi:serine/threonine protein phosphatase PrpC